jgi:cell division control protein 11
MRAIFSDSSILPEELATQSVRLKEEQLRREEEKVCVCAVYCTLKSDDSIRQLREIELKVQREINEKRQELLAKEESLR